MRAPRGAAITELALVLPMLVTILLFGMFFTELVRAKLKLQEASRYVVWEMTSYTLSDYGGTAPTRNQQAFDLARTQTLDEAQLRYRDLDSVEDKGTRGSFMAGYSGLTIDVEDEPVNASGNFSVQPGGRIGGPFIGAILSAFNGTTDQVYRRFGFNTRGQLRAELSVRLDNRILPRRFLDGSGGFFSEDQWGGRSLQSVKLKGRYVMIATGWQLPDGGDAQMLTDVNRGGEQSGVHRGDSIHGLWLQVNRMSHLGVTQSIGSVSALQYLMRIFKIFLPSPFTSTFVTAHNYGLDQSDLRECDSGPGSHDSSHPAKDGLNNLDKYSRLDHPWRKCFDTAPFRDMTNYDSNDDSLYVKQFKARGDYFMGCPNPQADDPTFVANPPSSRSDRNTRKVDCGP